MDTDKEIKLPDGWFSNDNIVTYRKLVSQIPVGGHMAELGCWKGRSICSVADIIKEREITVMLIDNFSGEDDEVGVYGDVQSVDVGQECVDNLKAFGIVKVGVYKLDTHDASQKMRNDLDFIFIDADHSYDAVLQDITDWRPKLKEGGMMAGHDFYRTGVLKALKETIWPVENETTIWFRKLYKDMVEEIIIHHDEGSGIENEHNNFN